MRLLLSRHPIRVATKDQVEYSSILFKAIDITFVSTYSYYTSRSNSKLRNLSNNDGQTMEMQKEVECDCYWSDTR